MHDSKGKLTEVHATRGVDQRCVLGAPLFALAKLDPAEQAPHFAQQHDPKAALFLYF